MIIITHQQINVQEKSACTGKFSFFFREVPDILSYLSYLFHFQAVLTGPLSYYSDYMHLVNKTHVAIDSKGNVSDMFCYNFLVLSGFESDNERCIFKFNSIFTHCRVPCHGKFK